MKKYSFLAAILLARTAAAATIWTNGAADSSWSDAANWSAGVPFASSDAVIGTQPSANIIGIDTGVISNTVQSLTLSSALTSGVAFLAAGVEQLEIASALTNQSAFAATFQLPVTIGSNSATYETGGGVSFDAGLTVLSSSITLTGASPLTLGSSAATTMTLASSTDFASFTGSGTVDYNFSTLQIDITQAGIAPGTSWQLFANHTGSFSGIALIGDNYSSTFTESSPGLWQATSGGVIFAFNASTGTLSAVPEPGVVQLLIVCIALAGFGFRRLMDR